MFLQSVYFCPLLRPFILLWPVFPCLFTWVTWDRLSSRIKSYVSCDIQYFLLTVFDYLCSFTITRSMIVLQATIHLHLLWFGVDLLPAVHVEAFDVDNLGLTFTKFIFLSCIMGRYLSNLWSVLQIAQGRR